MEPDWIEMLDRCSMALGVEFDATLARRALASVQPADASGADLPWFEAFSRVGKELGLRGDHFSGTVRAAAALSSPQRPLIAAIPRTDGTTRWIILSGRSGRKVRVGGGSGRLVDAATISHTLGGSSPRASLDWAIVSPVLGRDDPHDAHSGHDHGPGPISRLIAMMRPESADLRAIVLYAMGVGVLSLATPLAVESLVTTVAMNMLVGQVVVLTLVLLVCLGMAAIFRALQAYLAEVVQRRIFLRVASVLANRLPRIRVDGLEGQYGPELVNRFFEVVTIQKAAALLLIEGVAIVLQTVIGLSVLAFYHPLLLGFDLVVVAAMVFTILQLGRGAVATSLSESRAKYAMVAGLEEIARAPLAYKLNGGPEFARDRIDALARRYLTNRCEHYAIVFRQVVFSLGFQAASTAGLLGLGGWLVITEQLTLGQLVAAELIVATVVGAFAKSGKLFETWYDLMAAVNKIGHLYDLPEERHDGEHHPAVSARLGLRIRGLTFSYDGHREVLSNLNLDVAPGEHVALCGPSGVGKSTLADLMFGLIAPQQGHIAISGVNLRDLSLEALRHSIALVRGLEVVEGTVIDNVRMGRSSMTLSQVQDALREAGLLEALAALPLGLHTRLSPSGAPLSSGQSRRLMLARALAGNPQLLVLDEALDGVDLVQHGPLIRALFEPAAHRTVILITHRPDLVEFCDRKFVLSAPQESHGTTMAMTHGSAPNDTDRGIQWPTS